MRRRLRYLGPLAAAILVSAVMLIVHGCKPKEQLDPHFRPRFKESKFKDVTGDPAEGPINAFVTLGVFDFDGDYFMPEGIIERGTYVQWLIRAWNIYYRDEPKQWIRLAEVTPNAGWTYGDVMPHTPLYPYLEGMIQAGLPVGFEKGEWDYARNLKREQLILLRDGVVMGKEAVLAPEEVRDDYRVSLRSMLSDADEIEELYLKAVASDIAEGEAIRLAFKDVDLVNREQKPMLQPGRLVSRREAVLSLSKLGRRTYKHASVKALGSWKPLPDEEQKALDKADEDKRHAASGGHDHEHEH
jgi:hypothetical protein